jgi:hypothetical protein
MNITIEKAETVAAKMVSSRMDTLGSAKKAMKAKASSFVMAALPTLVKDCFEKHPDYFSSRDTTVRLVNAHGDELHMEARSPLGWGETCIISDEQHAELRRLYAECKAEGKAIDELERDIKNTLKSLKTYTRVKEQFPEAYALLPQDKTAALSIPIDDIRNRLVPVG